MGTSVSISRPGCIANATDTQTSLYGTVYYYYSAEGFAKKLGRHAVHHAVDSSNGNNNNQRRELQQAELFGRDLDLEELLGREYDLEAREPAFGRFSLLSSVFLMYAQLQTY